MAEENKLNQTPEITPAPSAETPEKAPTTGELLGDVEHYDEDKDDCIKAELALQDAKLEAGIDPEKEKSPGLIGKYHDWKKNRVRHKVNKKKYLLLCICIYTLVIRAICCNLICILSCQISHVI